MRSLDRLKEVIDTLNAEAVGDATVLILAYAIDVIDGFDPRDALGDAVVKLATAHTSPHVAELATEVLAHMRAKS